MIKVEIHVGGCFVHSDTSIYSMIKADIVSSYLICVEIVEKCVILLWNINIRRH